ncbi:DUF4406 domain-containing protein [Sporomusa sphaeroides DSM 2875]|uniref:DUF7768 domain-containing protein n=1 Tax=Sporomusa sphaeroides TaxID=47679 RepID=UPI00202FA5D4|nr:DUF4406 domain-containing protein [Sporomusa sphaeroides]MCM0759589.1 DUF4406 domain-containing protein [Sporomusa sphaeroides DSM 2875]
MLTAYIAHPLRGDIDNNLKRVHAICQQYHAQGNIIPISPLHAFGFVDPTGPQELVLKYCCELLSRCDELWLHGDWQKSEGCRMEAEHADRLGIPVRFMEAQSGTCDLCARRKPDCQYYHGVSACKECRDTHKQTTERVDQASKYLFLQRLEATK